MEYTRISPPERGEHDDPRDMLWVCVDDLYIDPAVQRGLQRGSPVWKTEWSWPKVETVTVADRDGKFYVVEGQNRVEKRKLIAPGSFMWAVLAPESGREAEASAALGISRGRRAHSAYDTWKLSAEAGGQHELAAEAVLHDFGLGLTTSARPTRMGITAISALSIIIKRHERTPEQGAALLEKVLKVITQAFEPEETARFETGILRGIADIFDANPDRKVDIDRLVRVAKQRTPDKWLSMARDAAGTHNETTSAWVYVAREMLRFYNKGLQKDGPRILAWSRDAR